MREEVTAPLFRLKYPKIGKHLYLFADFFVPLRSEFDLFG